MFSLRNVYSYGVLWMTEAVENDALEKGLEQPLLVSSEDKQQDEDGDQQECDESEEASEDSHQAATSEWS
jgi:hypothetical protein